MITNAEASYEAPKDVVNTTHCTVYYEPSLTGLRAFFQEQFDSTANQFINFQQNSSARAFSQNRQAVDITTHIIQDSISPLDKDAAAITAAFTAFAKSRERDGFGYTVVAMPAVHIWSKKTAKILLANHENPPWVSLDPASHSLNQTFFAQDNSMNPLFVVVDESESMDQQQEGIKAFLSFWLSTLRTGNENLLGAFVFTTTRDFTMKDLQTKAQMPDWLNQGISALVATDVTSRLLGDGAAKLAQDAVLGGPISDEKEVGSIIKNKAAAGNGLANSASVQRAYFQLVSMCQENTSRSFVHMCCSAVASSNQHTLSDQDVKELYRSVAPKGKDLLGL